MSATSKLNAALQLILLVTSASASVGFQPPRSYTVGAFPQSVTVADFNNDGKLDLAVAILGNASAGDDGGVSILLGNGDGSFQSPTNLSLVQNPTQVASGDFNGDGNSDLIVLRPGDSSVGDNGGISLFLGNGNGTFGSAMPLASGTNPVGVSVSDLNGDHQLDLIFANQGDSNVTVLLGNGDATFQRPVAYSLISPPRRTWALDINQDGKSDLAVLSAGSVTFFFGNGDGTFQKGPSVYAGLRSFSTIGDFNQDGKFDLVDRGCGIFPPIVCSTSIRFGNGDGTFQSPQTISDISGAVAADIDGDGKLDLAGSGLVVALGNGDGTFSQPLTFAAGTSPVLAKVADLDGDKAPDLVAFNASDNAITVLRNSGTDFSLSASLLSPSSVTRGQSATSTVSLSLLNAFDNSVSLVCTVKPAQAGSPTCSLSSNSVTFDPAGKASATLTVTARSAVASLLGPYPNVQDSLPFRFIWLPVAGVAFMGAGLNFGLSRKRKLLPCLAGAVMFGLLSQLACGGGGASSGPKSASYTVTVTGVSGSTQHSTALTLTVQ